MPYDNPSDLPDGVRNNLPKHAQEIYRVAWGAVEDKYERNANGDWVSKDD